MRSRLSVIAVLVTALVGLAGTAHAANFAVTGKNRQFCCTNPPAFIYGQPAKKGGIQPTVNGKATVVGSGPATVKVGKSQVINFYSKFHWGPASTGGTTPAPAGFKFIQGTASAANGAATLKKNGGYGSFSFCPKAKGPGIGACTAPSKATPASFNGRIHVAKGPNKFGGTMQILAGKGGIGGSKIWVWRWVGPSSMYPAATVKLPLYSSIVGAMTPAKLKVVSGLKSRVFTHTPGSGQANIIYKTQGMLSANGAGPFTTGKLTLQVTKNGTPSTRSVVYSGYDKRTAMGKGNVQLVSGILFNTFNNLKSGSVPIAWRVRLPEPSPSLGLAAGALGLLLISLVGTRRRR